MSNKNYCFVDNPEVQIQNEYIITNNKQTLRQSSSLIYNNKDKSIKNNVNNNSKGKSSDNNNNNNNNNNNELIIDHLINQMIENLPKNNSTNKHSFGKGRNNLIISINKPSKLKNSNLSLNILNNKTNFFKKLNSNLSLNNNSSNNNIIKTSFNNKLSQINNSNFINITNHPTNPNPTILKSSFIMAGIEKKKSNAAESKSKNNNFDVDLQSILNTNNNGYDDTNKAAKENFSLSKKQNYGNNYCSNNNDLNKIAKNNRLVKSSFCTYAYDNSSSNKNKSQNININTRSKSKNNSVYVLTNSQNEYLSKMAPKTNKNRSISFNNSKYNPLSTNKNSNLKRYNSQNIKGFISNKAPTPDAVNSYYCNPLEYKNSFDLINKRNYFMMKILNESKSKSIIDIKKNYNEVFNNKCKKLPTSLSLINKSISNILN